VRTLGGDNARKQIMADAKATRKLRNNPNIGMMYNFVYDAKWKDELPYWDAFPLIIMVGPAPNGFYGINLHYLPPKARAILFDNLLAIASDTKYNERTKLQLSYQLLSSSSKYKLFRPCFKHYLFTHLRSQLAFIPPKHWDAALFMPTASFQKAVNSKVWSDSILETT